MLYYMLYVYNIKEGNSEIQRLTLNEYKEKYEQIKKDCTLRKKARNKIIKTLINPSILPTGNTVN